MALVVYLLFVPIFSAEISDSWSVLHYSLYRTTKRAEDPNRDSTSHRIRVPVFAMIPVHLAAEEAGVARVRYIPRNGCRTAWLGVKWQNVSLVFLLFSIFILHTLTDS